MASSDNEERLMVADAGGAVAAVPSVIPRHVAVIMDGNGRWAKQRFLPRIEGHRNGARTVRMIVEEARRLGIQHLTLFAFSTENWGRPEEEVGGLMRLFVQYLENEVELLSKNGVRLRAMGDLSRLSSVVQEALRRCEDRTKHLDGMDLIVAVSYGGRGELVHAFQKIAESVKSGEIEPKDISEEMISAAMYMPDVPHPDLLIRTSNEQRISNFLLWQLAYSEIVVSPLLWPDFSRDEFHRCLHVFAGRSRRFGLTQEQIR